MTRIRPHSPDKTIASPLAALMQRCARRFPGLLFGIAWLWMGQAAHAAEPQVTEGFINAATPEVWRIFTTAEGYKQMGVAHAEVDLKIGGTIRTHYDPKGQLGDPRTIVNEILAYEPERMLATRVKQAPADFPYPDAIAGTWNVIYLTPAGDNMTQVRIIGLGYTDEPQSVAMRKFFAEGNRWTLDHIAKGYWPKCAKCVADEAAAEAAR
ncbi:SRPBCC domain-containing protein [Steroidobacter sp. S1-65]|uniref:SRPBCC domain-containing protein n=1 Tax=Steroidobacter gossypii TaxID=2805490 RepID=A0ABS1WST9_9GAMM|nr:SRPBCC domain-containing protein [Steroidobacter gossypii]MBM0104049.1 SRPBCC domain-containing protein [Steroidobacter gossypii]